MNNLRYCSYLALALLVLVGPVAWGQGTASKVTGVVQDPSGALIPQAKVTLRNEGTQLAFTTQTSTGGTYVFEAVQIGVYTLEVEVTGFRKFVSRGNILSIGQPLTINATLEVGAVTETVEVREAAELVQTATSGNFGNLVDDRAMTSLPLVGTRGRNPLNFTLYQPFVVSGANTGGGVHVSGSRDRAWNFTLDGIDINESSAGGSNFTPLRPNPDSVAEFRVLTGQFTAEYGRNSGGQVTMVTRSGSNEFHGNLFWFYRTPRLHANEWRNNRVGLAKAQFVQNIGGFSVGGPIFKNRTFFFTNLQFLRTSEKRGVTRSVYTTEARSGVYRYITSSSIPCPGQTARRNAPSCVDANGNPLPGLTIGTYDVVANDPAGFGRDPDTQAFIDLTPLPNDFTSGDGFNVAGFTWVPAQREKQEDFVVKVDHTFNEKNTAYVRYARGRQDTTGDDVNGGLARFPATPRIVDTNRSPGNLAVNWRSTLTPSIVNEFVFGWNHFTFNFANPDPNFASNAPFVLNNVTDPITNYIGNLRSIDTYQWVDNLTHVRGPHTFKAGINFRYQQHEDVRGSVGGANVMPEVTFSTSVNTVDATAFNLPATTTINSTDLSRLRSTINDLLGRVGQISQGFVSTADGSAFAPGGTTFIYAARYGEYDFYVQDTWKFRPNLTLELGLRWEVKLSPSAAGRQTLVPDQLVVAGAPVSNTLRWEPGQLYKDDRDNFGPLVGLVWDPFKDGKTAVRANYRMAFDRTNTFVISSTIFQSFPGQTIGVFDTTFGSGGGRVRDGLPTLFPAVTPQVGLQPAAFGTGVQTVFDPNWQSPETHLWGLSIQRDLGHDLIFEVSYNGRHGVNLYGAYNINSANINAFDPATCAGETFLQAFNVVAAGGTSCLMNALFSSQTATGSAFVRSNFSTTLAQGSVGGLAAAINTRRLSSGARMIEASGFSPSFFTPFSQFTGLFRVLDSNDFSYYHGGSVQLSRRFRGGLGFQISYTLAKSLDNRSFDPAFSVVSTGAAQSASSTPWDIFDRRLNKARSDFDRRHALQGYWVYELPLGAGKQWGSELTGVLGKIAEGWTIGGILRWMSGRPFTVYGVNSFTNSVASPADCSNCPKSMGRVHASPTNGEIFYFDAAERTQFSLPAPGTMGNTGRNYFQLDEFFSLDLAVGKRTRITETQTIEFRMEADNLTNTPAWDVPTATVTSATFGRLLIPSLGSRKMQLVLKYNF